MVDGIIDRELETVYIINTIASLLSVLGCLFIIFMYFLCKELKKLAFRIIAILSAFDLLNAISFIIPTYGSQVHDLDCVLQGIFMNFSAFAAVLWTSFIAVVLFFVVVKGNTEVSKLMLRFFIFDLVLSGLLTAFPYFVENENDEGYCWLYKGQSKKKYRLRFYTFLVPLWIIIFIEIYLFVRVYRNLRGSEGGEIAILRRKLSIKIGVYPFIIIVCYLPYTIKGIMEIQDNFEETRLEYKLTIVSGVIRCLIGLFNAIAYGLTGKVKKILRRKLCFNKPSTPSTLMANYRF